MDLLNLEIANQVKQSMKSYMGTKTKLAYLDSSALIAFLDRSDTFFPVFSQAFRDPPNLVSTALVVAETHGWFLRRYDASRARRFLQFFQELPNLEVAPVGPKEIEKGTKIMGEFLDQPLTMVDAVGLSIIRERKISICWSTDRHLTLTRAQLLIHLR